MQIGIQTRIMMAHTLMMKKTINKQFLLLKDMVKTICWWRFRSLRTRINETRHQQ